MISLRGITKTYELPGGQPVDALRDVDLRSSRASSWSITGRSGSGKTTLLNVIAGLTRPSAGRSCDGADLWSLSDRERSLARNRDDGLRLSVPQPAALAHGARQCHAAPGLLPDAPGRTEAGAIELLEMVGLSDRLGSYPRQLSAGQQQRVVIARALINGPELLLADEPSSDLDEDTETEIMTLLRPDPWRDRRHDRHGHPRQTAGRVRHASRQMAGGTVREDTERSESNGAV